MMIAIATWLGDKNSPEHISNHYSTIEKNKQQTPAKVLVADTKVLNSFTKTNPPIIKELTKSDEHYLGYYGYKRTSLNNDKTEKAVPHHSIQLSELLSKSHVIPNDETPKVASKKAIKKEITVKSNTKAEKTITKQTNIAQTVNASEQVTADYWQTVYSIESKQGKLLYRPRNKARNCDYTTAPCGHHQLTVQALKDIGCKSLQCRKDRLNYKKSLAMSKKLLALNEKRLKKYGITKLEGYQKYLIHQQGANGIKNILSATKGKKALSKEVKKNMANNSPYSYKQFKRMGSKAAAEKFMQHWERKWNKEQKLVASIQTASNNKKTTPLIPVFNDQEINLALNYRF